jgi:sugar lactone lactonase YvrE
MPNTKRTRENPNSRRPLITAVDPPFALAGGEIRVTGENLMPGGFQRPSVSFDGSPAHIVLGSDREVIVRVPEEAAGPLTLTAEQPSDPVDVRVARLISDELHPVTNPAVDRDGNIFVTVSGSRGQSVPVAVFKIDTEDNITPYVPDLMNATGLALDSEGNLYVSSRFDGSVYHVAPDGTRTTYAESMGVATGMAFDHERNLYVGDRSGTIFKIAPDRQIYVFATLEPSVAAYHLAFAPDGSLFVAGPTTSSNDCIYRVDPQGSVTEFFRGLGRPQGLAFDFDGNLYAAASVNGRRGIVRFSPDGEPSLVVSGQNVVGLAFAPDSSVVIATGSGVHHLNWGISGRILVAD